MRTLNGARKKLGLAALVAALLLPGMPAGATTTCGNAAYDNGNGVASYWFDGEQAGNPNCIFAVRFQLADFGFDPGETEIAGFCAGNDVDYGGPWPNQVFVHPDDGGMPDVSTLLAEGTIYTGDGSGQYEVSLTTPVTLNGDFWLVLRGDPMWAGEDVNMEVDGGPGFGASYLSDCTLPHGGGIANLAIDTSDVNYILRADLQSTTGPPPPADCGTAAYDDGTTVDSAYFGGGKAGDPNYMMAVNFALADFGFTAGQVQLNGFCAGNNKTWPLGPWPNEVFVYPDSGGAPDEGTVLAQGTVSTGDGTGQYEVVLSEPAPLDGDFWLVVRGDPQWVGKDFNLEFDNGPATGNSYVSETGVAGLAQAAYQGYPQGVNFILRADVQPRDRVYINGFESGDLTGWLLPPP